MRTLWRKSYSLAAALCVVLVYANYDIAMSQDLDNQKCPQHDEFALRVEYAIEDQYRANGFLEAGAPVSVRGDEKRIVILRGNSSWERLSGTRWVTDADAEKLTEEMETIMKAIDEQGGEGTPEQRMRLYEIMSKERPKNAEARRTDSIRVEVPPPGWSFSYDKVSRLGSKYVKTEAISSDERMLLASNSEFRGYLHQMVQTSEIQPTGERKIAGYTCEHTVVTRPARFEYCTAEIGGRQVDLYRRIEQPEGFARIETAVSVEVGACIDEARFKVPDEVELIVR